MRLIDLDDYSHVFCGHDGEYEKWNIDPEAIVPTIEPKKGRWIEYDNSHCECPFCHEEWSYFDNEVERFNFCPNCGADMREGETP